MEHAVTSDLTGGVRIQLDLRCACVCVCVLQFLQREDGCKVTVGSKEAPPTEVQEHAALMTSPVWRSPRRWNGRCFVPCQMILAACCWKQLGVGLQTR